MVSIRFINEKEVNIYLIIGGEIGKSNTGLIVDITNAKFAHKTNIKKGTPPEGEKIAVVSPQLSGENIMVVIEPNLKDQQSMFLTNLFVFNPSSKTYSKKQSFLQVLFIKLSGVAYRSICRIFMELRLNFDAIRSKIAQSAFLAQPMSS